MPGSEVREWTNRKRLVSIKMEAAAQSLHILLAALDLEFNRDEFAEVGGGRDAHGCSLDGGYHWCESSKTHAETPCPSGGGADAHGCVADGGYRWCAPLGQCVRPWETPCPSGGGADAHGCVADGGYHWCATLGQCVRPWEMPCPMVR